MDTLDKWKFDTYRQDSLQPRRIGHTPEASYFAPNKENMLEAVLLKQLEQLKCLHIDEDYVRMEAVIFANVHNILLPKGCGRRMSKIWFDGFMARHPFLFVKMYPGQDTLLKYKHSLEQARAIDPAQLSIICKYFVNESKNRRISTMQITFQK